MKQKIALVASLLCLYGSGWSQALWHVDSHNPHILIPDSGLVRREDRGVKSHTNYEIYADSGLTLPWDNLTRGPAAPGTLSPPFTPAQMRTAYGIPSSGAGGVICIVDAYDNPNALGDFNVFSAFYSLPVEPSLNPTLATNAVFQVVYAGGSKPTGNKNWSLEESLDIEWAHAMAPNAKIVLVEANDAFDTSLFPAVVLAHNIAGCKAVSMSFGRSEVGTDTSLNGDMVHPGTIFFASAGDSGAAADFPADSPNVICAGGTSLTLDTTAHRVTESGWSKSGGGESTVQSRPPYQAVISSIVGNFRGVPDIAYDADPATGVPVFNTDNGGWFQVGGTSLSSPALAGIFVNSGIPFSSSENALEFIYNGLGTADYFDVVTGNNGKPCKVGWDYVTGVGTPIGDRSSEGSKFIVTLLNTSIYGGQSVKGNLTLASAAPGGATFTVTSDHPTLAACAGSPVSIGGLSAQSFIVSTAGVSSNTTVNVMATYSGTTHSVALTLKPAVLSNFVISPGTVQGGNNSGGTILVAGSCAVDTAVGLSSNNGAVVPPATVTVSANTGTKAFTLPTVPVDTTQTATVTASFGGVNKTATLKVTPPVTALVQLTPATVIGGKTVSGSLYSGANVILSGKAGPSGAVVSLSSSNTAAATVPSTITVAAGATSAYVRITTFGQVNSTTSLIGATFNSVTKSSTLTVQPAPIVKLVAPSTSLVGGTSVTATAVIDGLPGPSGTLIMLTSSDSHAVVPASVTIAAGSSRISFTITTTTVVSGTGPFTANIVGTDPHGNSQTLTLTIHS